MLKPGMVVTVLFPGVQGTKPRPVVVVSTDLYQSSRPDLILGLVTSNLLIASAPTDYVLQDWSAAGLRKPSAFRAFLLTLPATNVRRLAGQLTDRDWQEVQARMRLALAVA
jgi:mRNA-degrading endonuclease toxin of MazEF toxin-antitoxin module